MSEPRENIYTATPSGHADILTLDTKVKVIDKICPLSDLRVVLEVPNEAGEVERYVIIYTGDRAKAILGDRFNDGDKLCVRLGDRTIPHRNVVYNGSATGSANGSSAAKTGAYAEPARTKVLPDDATIGTVVTVPPAANVELSDPSDEVGATTWPPTCLETRYHAILYTISAANELIKHTRLRETVEVF